MIKELPPLSPACFFSYEIPLQIKEGFQTLPDFSFLTGAASFVTAKVRIEHGGITLFIDCAAPFVEAHFPEVEKGDGIELFIDTRGGQGAKTLTKFCHHFVFLPAAVEGIFWKEVTTFRGDDVRPLAEESLIDPIIGLKRKGYTYEVFLSKKALFGYEPHLHPQIGFAFRVHRTGGSAYHFGISADDMAIDSHPGLWPVVHLQGA